MEEAFADEKKREVFNKFMNDVPMAGYENDDGKYVKGVEDYLPNSQYIEPEHQNAVVNDICDNWSILSVNKKFHAIFATSSIPEAIEYYGLFKDKMPSLKVTCLLTLISATRMENTKILTRANLWRYLKRTGL